MRYRRWIIALTLAAFLGPAPSSQAGIKDLLHRKEKKKQEQAQVGLCIKQRAWIGYYQDDDGVRAAVRDTQSTENDQDWIGLRFTEYDGPRIRLGVLKVINKSAESEERGWAEKIEVPVSGIQEMLTVALYNTRRFDVVEQKRIQEVEGQQARKDVVEPSPTSIVNMGKVLGVQYLVYGTVNEWTPDRAHRSVGSGGLPGLGGLGGMFKGGKNEAEVAITFSLTDVSNGQILYTTAERARMGEWSFGVGGPEGGGGTTQKTPVGYAIQACANKAAFKIATFLRNRKWRGSVVDIKGPDIYINAGNQQGMAPQTKLSVNAVKGIVRDAESGTILGEDLRGIGTLEVIVVQTGFSVARVIDGCKGIKKGDRVELATAPVPPPTTPECAALDVTASL
ncbi:MAG TPA: CsgG/HfaB family protein [Thermoanaerobaculia bacterium]|nr:CsgG/HfaB family protein [Thermoanaerobaculia bacterium]